MAIEYDSCLHIETVQVVYFKTNKDIERNEYWKFRESKDFNVCRLGRELSRKERGKV